MEPLNGDEFDDECDDVFDDDDPYMAALFTQPEIDRPVDGEFDQDDFLNGSTGHRARNRGQDPLRWETGNSISDFDGPASADY